MTERHKTRKYLKIFAISFLLILVLGYTGYEIHKVVFGPRILVTYPQNGALLSTPTLEITGVASNIKDISLDDRKIFIDEQGNFTEEVLLSYGYNTIVLRATDKFDRKTEKVLEVIYK